MAMPHLLQSYFGQKQLRLNNKASIKIHKLYTKCTGCHNEKFHRASVCLSQPH